MNSVLIELKAGNYLQIHSIVGNFANFLHILLRTHKNLVGFYAKASKGEKLNYLFLLQRSNIQYNKNTGKKLDVNDGCQRKWETERMR